jgi:hypothetical protein
MPREFDVCVRNGGQVATVSGPDKEHGLEAGEYVRYCVIHGESFRGHVKKKKRKSKTRNSPKED